MSLATEKLSMFVAGQRRNHIAYPLNTFFSGKARLELFKGWLS